MPKQLISKPCQLCGRPVYGIRRADRNAFHYSKRCSDCKGKPSSERITEERRKRINAARVVHPIGTKRLHRIRDMTYVVVKVDNRKRWPYEHRVVAERMIGRKLKRGEVVHHVNEDTLDNRPENLRVMLAGDHVSMHGKITAWSRKHSECIECKGTERKHLALGYCTRCYQRRS